MGGALRTGGWPLPPRRPAPHTSAPDGSTWSSLGYYNGRWPVTKPPDRGSPPYTKGKPIYFDVYVDEEGRRETLWFVTGKCLDCGKLIDVPEWFAWPHDSFGEVVTCDGCGTRHEVHHTVTCNNGIMVWVHEAERW
jgi:hypothetical protein